MYKTIVALSLLLTTLFFAGCATTLTAVPLTPAAREDLCKGGIPYYLPKPYLLVAKNVNAIVEKTAAEKPATPDGNGGKPGEGTGAPAGKPSSAAHENIRSAEPTNQPSDKPTPGTISTSYSYQIVYLPDLRLKYGLKFKRGTEAYESNIHLENGWMFTGVEAKGDAKTAETIQAVGSLVKDLASATATGAGAANRVHLEGFFPMGEPTPSVGKEPPAAIWIYEIGGNAENPMKWNPVPVLTWPPKE